jgi:hypothetical protein
VLALPLLVRVVSLVTLVVLKVVLVFLLDDVLVNLIPSVGLVVSTLASPGAL